MNSEVRKCAKENSPRQRQGETVIIWDASRPDEMRALVMAGVQVRIPITRRSDNHCDRCDHWDICEGCPYTDERGAP